MSATATPPAIESLLSSVHQALEAQRVMLHAFVQQGVDETQVPNADVRLAFACLGDHDRVSVAQQLAPYWSPLAERALVFSDVAGYSTPVLRLLLTMAPQLMAVSDINTRLEHGPFIPAAPTMFRPVVRNPHAIWGDPVRIDYEVTGLDYIRITPDDVFARQVLLRRVQGNTETRFVELPADDGRVVFTMLGKDGRIYGHTVELRLPQLEASASRRAA